MSLGGYLLLNLIYAVNAFWFYELKVCHECVLQKMSRNSGSQNLSQKYVLPQFTKSEHLMEYCLNGILAVQMEYLLFECLQDITGGDLVFLLGMCLQTAFADFCFCLLVLALFRGQIKPRYKGKFAT